MRVAIVGAGLMGRWHGFYAKQWGARVALIVDPDASRAEALAKRHGAAVASSLASGLEQHEVEVVQLCTPIETHYELACLALDAGKHVIIEKPMAQDLEQVEALLLCARERGLLLVPVHQFAFQPGIQEAQQELARRSTGALSVSFDFASAGGEGHPQEALDRILLEILPHPLSILQQLWPGRAEQAAPWSVQHPSPGELSAQGQHGALPVTLRLSMNARPTHCYMTIYHADGALRLDLFHGFAAFDSAVVSRRAKLLAPFVRSAKTFGVASINLIKRSLKGQPAYPGLGALLSACYTAIESKAAAPIGEEHIRAVSQACSAIEEEMSK